MPQIVPLSRGLSEEFIKAAGGEEGIRMLGLTSIAELFLVPDVVPLTQLLVADQGAAVLGWLIVKVDAGKATLAHLFVIEADREKGFGRQLVERAVDAIWGLPRIDRIEAFILQGNEYPIRILRRLDFLQTAVRTARHAPRGPSMLCFSKSRQGT